MNPSPATLQATPMLQKIKRYFQDSPYPDDFWAKVLGCQYLFYLFLLVACFIGIYLLIIYSPNISTELGKFSAAIAMIWWHLLTLLSLTMLVSSIFLFYNSIQGQRKITYYIYASITTLVVIPFNLIVCLFWYFLPSM